jgi:tetratricopeptide (TPR) repeat protein
MDEALKACLKAYSLKPSYQEASLKIGVIYFGQQQYREALPFLTSITLPTLLFFSNAYASMALAGMGTVMGAEHNLKIAAQCSDAVPEVLSLAWGSLGRARMERSEFGKARESFQEACRLDPQNSQNWLDLGLTYHFVQDSKVASECFLRAMELDEAEVAA